MLCRHCGGWSENLKKVSVAKPVAPHMEAEVGSLLRTAKNPTKAFVERRPAKFHDKNTVFVIFCDKNVFVSFRHIMMPFVEISPLGTPPFGEIPPFIGAS